MSHTNRVYVPFVVLEQAYFLPCVVLIRCLLLFPAIHKFFQHTGKWKTEKLLWHLFLLRKREKLFTNILSTSLGTTSAMQRYIYRTGAKSKEPVYHLFLILVFGCLFHKFAFIQGNYFFFVVLEICPAFCMEHH